MVVVSRETYSTLGYRHWTVRELFADAEVPENDIEHVFDVYPPEQPLKRPGRQPNLLGDQFLAPLHAIAIGQADCLGQRVSCDAHHLPVPFPRDEAGFAAERSGGEIRDRRHQSFYAAAIGGRLRC